MSNPELFKKQAQIFDEEHKSVFEDIEERCRNFKNAAKQIENL
jgi:hypothetical protein